MIDTLITSKTRIKLLIKFFLNPSASSYLRELAIDLNENTNAIRIELNRLTEASILLQERRANKVFYRSNPDHPFFQDLKNIVTKYTGLGRLMEEVIGYLGNLERVYLIGDYAQGMDNGVIELIMTGDIKKDYLQNLLKRLEFETNRKICCTAVTNDELQERIESTDESILLLYDANIE